MTSRRLAFLPAVFLLASLSAHAAADAVDAKEMALVESIRAKILATPSMSVGEGYDQTIPHTTIRYRMQAIPAGEYLMGSPADEKERRADEGPQVKVRLAAFWMGRCEITWNEYELFMFAPVPAVGAATSLYDAVSHPTKPYVEMSFGMGRDGFPAISMTQHAANKYCQWLSAQTGHYYRLPTEAEWEYAARAGTTTAYSFGADAQHLKEYAVCEAEQYAKVGSKKPNAWGLCDMHGNVTEWTLDQYQPEAYARFAADPKGYSWIRSTEPYPHVVRGGSWADTPDRLRSAARRGSSPDWKLLDPQLPKSVWYHTSAPWLGFRIVRQLEIPSAEEMYRTWNNGVSLD